MKIHKKSRQENDLTSQMNIFLNPHQLYSSGVTERRINHKSALLKFIASKFKPYHRFELF